MRGNPCVRCGSETRRREPNLYPDADANNRKITHIDICVMCGNEESYIDKTVVREVEVDDELAAILEEFREIRKKSYKLGLRKYRNNKEEKAFQGSPVQVGQKNLAAFANCLAILKANADYLEFDSLLSEKDYVVMMQVIEKLFVKFQRIKDRVGLLGTNEFQANAEAIF